jgi:uncharacterized membrane protein
VSHRLTGEAERIRRRVEEGDPFWPAQLAVALAIVLYLALSDRVTIGPTWLVPAVELVLLVTLVRLAPARATEHDTRRRRLGLTVVGLVSATNIASLVLLVHFLVTGGQAGGERLILSGLVLWVTNVLLFAVWFWELDGGGPVARFRAESPMPDFRFPQDDLGGPFERWRPGFHDYLYTSLTNAMAFSPTDTMPLTLMAKAVMAIQSVSALATIALVLARAVNILA